MIHALALTNPQAATIIAIVIAAIVLVWAAWTFNRLVRHRNLVDEGFSGIDVQLKRRHNLVPALVETVKGYAAHEKGVLEKVTALRGESAASLRQTCDSENALTDALKGLFALAEAYPDLKADRRFGDLQRQLADIEDQLQMARRYYNGAVRDYNIRIESFPGNLIAGAFGFARREFFEIDIATERLAPKVEID